MDFMKKIIGLICLMFVLVSCGENEVVENETIKIEWRKLDVNCDIDDIVIWKQIWAWCNSTLWNWLEFWQLDSDIWKDKYSWIIKGCAYYNWWKKIWCSKWNESMNSNSKANLWFDWINKNWDYEFENIWWKLYTFDNISSACSNGRKVPSDKDWLKLESYLNWWKNCKNTKCEWLWWKWHKKAWEKNVANLLKIPLSWFRFSDSKTYMNRWNTGYLWAVEWKKIFDRLFYVNTSSIFRYEAKKTYAMSIRCIKK